MPITDICSFGCVLFTLEFKINIIGMRNLLTQLQSQRSEYMLIANCGDLEYVTPEYGTFCHLIWDIGCSQTVIM